MFNLQLGIRVGWIRSSLSFTSPHHLATRRDPHFQFCIRLIGFDLGSTHTFVGQHVQHFLNITYWIRVQHVANIPKPFIG